MLRPPSTTLPGLPTRTTNHELHQRRHWLHKSTSFFFRQMQQQLQANVHSVGGTRTLRSFSSRRDAVQDSPERSGAEVESAAANTAAGSAGGPRKLRRKLRRPPKLLVLHSRLQRRPLLLPLSYGHTPMNREEEMLSVTRQNAPERI